MYFLQKRFGTLSTVPNSQLNLKNAVALSPFPQFTASSLTKASPRHTTASSSPL